MPVTPVKSPAKGPQKSPKVYICRQCPAELPMLVVSCPTDRGRGGGRREMMEMVGERLPKTISE